MHDEICAAIEDLIPEAARLFERIRCRTEVDGGIVRAAFGEGETAAAEDLAQFSQRHGLTAISDHVGNLHVTMGPATEREVLLGSHLDSVPNGGNFDGLAGVVAGLVAQAAIARTGIRPAQAIRTIGFRGEESPWFGTAYLGSKLLLGLIGEDELDRQMRHDTGLSVREHLRLLGHNVVGTELCEKRMLPERVASYLELHIEQGPLLESRGVPVGLATAIRGNIRYPFARCRGQAAHSAAAPQHLRSDAVVATAKLVASGDREWSRLAREGHDDLVFTCGIFQTDPAEHAMTRVAGSVRFSLNIGATSDALMEEFHALLMGSVAEISREHRVEFELGERVGTPAVQLDQDLLTAIETAAAEAGIDAVRMPTVGHDAAMFARLGVPTSVILVRNQNGSHNPSEDMRMSDFCEAAKLLAISAVRKANS